MMYTKIQYPRVSIHIERSSVVYPVQCFHVCVFVTVVAFSLPQHLDILQVHKGNIFEVNLPNKVTKIMEVPKKGTVREAIDPILKKNSYSLDVMDLKFADTLKVGMDIQPVLGSRY